MQISKKDWQNYINKMSALSQTAGEKLQEWVNVNGLDDVYELIKYSHALVTKYGEGASELACNMYDAISDLAEASVKSAVPAEVATFNETAKAIQGSLLRSPEGRLLSSVAQRLVKQAGADTMLKNAVRDKAQWAWIPSGDTCPFCITLASRGWQRASEKQLNGGHAEHIHANCNCQFAIRFSEKDNVKGYEPEKYRQMYESAEGGNSRAKINAMRRAKYSEKNKPIFSDEDEKKLKALRNKYHTLDNAMFYGTPDEMSEFKRLIELEKQSAGEIEYDKLFNSQSIKASEITSWRTIPSVAEDGAIGTYTSSQYTMMNGYLRQGDYILPKVKEDVEILHNYLEKQSTKETIYLKRGFSSRNPEQRLGIKNGDLNSIVGKNFSDKGFVSTTAFEGGGFGGNVIMYIKAPKGTKGAYVADISRASNEKEFLLDCGTNFIIRDARKVSGEYGGEIIEVFCEVIV